MLEGFSVLLGRHIQIRGVGRLLQALYPCSPESQRYVHGIRSRADGMKVDIDTRQLIDWVTYFHGMYEPQMSVLFEKLLGLDGVAVDVGANVGAHTLTLSRLAGANGRIVAFEPNPEIRQKLHRNVQLNALGNVSIFDCALGKSSEILQLRVPRKDSAEGSNPGLASLMALDTPHDCVEVVVRRFDDVADELAIQRLDLIKIDVQGYEQHVLEGMDASLRRFKPAVIFEFEEWAWKKSGSTWGGVYDLLADLHYEVWQVGVRNGGMVLLPATTAMIATSHMDILALPRGGANAKRFSIQGAV